MRLLRCCQLSLAVFSIARCLTLILVEAHMKQEETSQYLLAKVSGPYIKLKGSPAGQDYTAH